MERVTETDPAASPPHDLSDPISTLAGIGPARATALHKLGVQTRRDLRARLTEIHEAREHEQRLLTEKALARERAQLAREMHDVVSHQVSLITIQAGALQVNTGDPDTRSAAQKIIGSRCGSSSPSVMEMSATL